MPKETRSKWLVCADGKPLLTAWAHTAKDCLELVAHHLTGEGVSYTAHVLAWRNVPDELFEALRHPELEVTVDLDRHCVCAAGQEWDMDDPGQQHYIRSAEPLAPVGKVVDAAARSEAHRILRS